MIKNYKSDIDGVAAVEFSFIAPVLLFLLIGIIDFGLYFNDKIKVEAVARSAVEYLLVTQNEAGVMSEVVEPFYNAQNDAAWNSNFTMNTQMVCECEGGGQIDCVTGICTFTGDYKRRYYEVTMTKRHNTLFPYPGLDDFLDIEGDARMQYD